MIFGVITQFCYVGSQVSIASMPRPSGKAEAFPYSDEIRTETDFFS